MINKKKELSQLKLANVCERGPGTTWISRFACFSFSGLIFERDLYTGEEKQSKQPNQTDKIKGILPRDNRSRGEILFQQQKSFMKSRKEPDRPLFSFSGWGPLYAGEESLD